MTVNNNKHCYYFEMLFLDAMTIILIWKCWIPRLNIHNVTRFHKNLEGYKVVIYWDIYSIVCVCYKKESMKEYIQEKRKMNSIYLWKPQHDQITIHLAEHQKRWNWLIMNKNMAISLWMNEWKNFLTFFRMSWFRAHSYSFQFAKSSFARRKSVKLGYKYTYTYLCK